VAKAAMEAAQANQTPEKSAGNAAAAIIVSRAQPEKYERKTSI
jgi:hypothetical protein